MVISDNYLLLIKHSMSSKVSVSIFLGISYQKESQTAIYIYKDGHQNFIFLIYLLWFSLNINFPFWISYYKPFGLSETLQISIKYINMANFCTAIILSLHIATMWHYIYICFCQHFLVEQINFAYFDNAKYFRPPLY